MSSGRPVDPPITPAATYDLDAVPTATLIEIALAQHARFRAALPDVIGRATGVERAAAGRPDAPRGLAEMLGELAASQEEHMLREELRIFPLMTQGPSERLAAGIAVMRAEHDDNMHFLVRMAQLTGGYRAPEDAGAAWARLCADVERLADDLIAHIYVEERVLFPRFERGGEPPRDPFGGRRPERAVKAELSGDLA
jgi:regulator of cell morphogenesis and NO signaling